MRAPVLLLALLASGCLGAAQPGYAERFDPGPPCPPEPDATRLPECLARVADAFAAHMMGERLARAWVARNDTLTQAAPEPGPCRASPHDCAILGDAWLVAFDVRPPGYPPARAEVRLALDGRLVGPLDGLPPCRFQPFLCDLRVDEAEARRAARAVGVDADEVAFGLHPAHGFVWTASESSGEREGVAVVVSAVSGGVIDRSRWTTSA